MDRLFDPDPYSKPRRNYRDDRSPRPRTPPQVEVVVLGDLWRLTVGSRGPEAHAIRKRVGGAVVTFCDSTRIPLTFEPGQRAAGCAACLRSGAPR